MNPGFAIALAVGDRRFLAAVRGVGLLLCFVFGGTTLCAQKQGNIWYFPVKTGLSFESSPPTVLFNDQPLAMFNQSEGTSTMSSSDGHLLFYANGEAIFNRKHEIMSNGNLAGNFSSTNGAVVIPVPGNNNKYYIFTTGGWQYDLAGGLRYSVVDMCGDSGYGEIVSSTKNILLLDGAGEKLAFTQHANGVDYWLVAHKHFSTAFHVYRVTANGVEEEVITEIGTYHGRDGYQDGIGQMKISPAGTRLALVNENRSPDVVDVFDFDKTTGVVSNYLDLSGGHISYGIYGVSFSPNGTKLYTGARDGFFQYSLDLGSATNIIASKYKLASPVGAGGLQLGPDGKLYVNRFDYVGVVEFPDLPAPACNFIDHAISLQGEVSTYAFPTFVDNFDYPDKGAVPFGVDLENNITLCPGYEIDIGDYATGEGLTFQWQDGSTDPVYEFDANGDYTVTITDRFCTAERKIIIASPMVDLGEDTTLCEGDILILSPDIPGATYQWQNGSIASTFVAFLPGPYWVEANKDGCLARDTIVLNFLPLPRFSFGDTIKLCAGEVIELTIPVIADTYQWIDGPSTATISITESGMYKGVATRDGCSFSDIAYVRYTTPPRIELEESATLCEGNTLTIELQEGNYQWSNGSTSNVIEISEAGVYRVDGFAGSCSSSDSITVLIEACRIIMPNFFSPNGDVDNQEFLPKEIDGVTSASLYIYNRWETEIFRNDNFTSVHGWDGTGSRGMSDTGVYFWKVIYVTVDGKRHLLKGTVTLSR